MIRVLLVEDDREKRRLIAECIYSTSVHGLQVTIAGSVFEAKSALETAGYDLLLLDINLPKRADQAPVNEGGLEVLRWLKRRGRKHRPPYIVGTTAYEQAHQAALEEFDNLIWRVVRFKHADNSWREKLASTISHIADQIVPPYASDGSTFRTELGVLTALRRPELDALEKIATDWTEIPVANDESRYFRGSFKRGQRIVSFVAVAASDKGLPGAASAATKLIYSFRPRYIAMIGICAGVKGRVNIGDIIVADPTWDWGSGKFKQSRGVEVFHPASYQMRLDETLRNRALALRDDELTLARIRQEYGKDDITSPLKVHVGPLPSGGSVLQSSKAVKRVIAQHKDVLGIEMEIFAAMFACHTSPLPRPKCIGLKAVCDFGDARKNDDHQQYAAYTSAAVLRELVLNGLERPLTAAPPPPAL